MGVASILGSLAGHSLRLWRHTVRIEVRGLSCLDDNPRAVLASWHGRLQGPLFCVANRGVLTMASLSADGEFAARAVAPLGLEAARGSSGRGGGLALDQMREWLETGHGKFAGLTVDGPRGPLARARKGAVELARRLQVPIIPASFSARPHLMLRSWDRMVIALPLARMVVQFGPPLTIAEEESTNDACTRLKARLDEMTATLDLELHGHPLWDPKTIAAGEAHAP